MRLVKVMIIAIGLGLATCLLPQTSLAGGVSVGLSIGIPFPAIAIYPALPPPPPRVVYPAPAPVAFYPYYHRAYAYGPHYRHYEGYEYRGNGHRYYKRQHHNGY